MKTAKKIILSSALLALIGSGLASCGNSSSGGTPAIKVPFNFSAAFETGSETYLYVKGSQKFTDKLIITEYNKDADTEYNYRCVPLANEALFPSSDPISDYIQISEQKEMEIVAKDGSKIKKKYFDITPLKPTDKEVYDEETDKTTFMSRPINLQISYKKKPIMQQVEVKTKVDPAKDGYNWAGSGATRQKVLGKLEEYAMSNFLTGISLFENGGYVMYSDRADAGIPASEFITGYGWGLLADGRLTDENGNQRYLPGIPASQTASHPSFLQTASSSDPLSINAWDSTGSQVSDLNSYITSSYWGTKLKGTNDYEWYPILAQDGVDRPIPLDENHNPIVNPQKETLYNIYRIPVKTKLNGIVYHYTGTRTGATDPDTGSPVSFDGLGVELEDYLTVYQALLTQKSDLARGSELAGDTSYGIKGGAEYFRNTKSGTPATNDDLWNSMIATGTLGLRITPKDERTATNTYIDIEIINPIDQFTAMYTLSSNLYSPIPRSFLDAVGGGDYTLGAKNFGTFPNYAGSDIKDNILSLGPFQCIEWAKRSVISFARNKDWFEYKEDPNTHQSIGRYHIDGVRIRTIEGATEDPTAVWKEFTEGKKLDSAGIPASVISSGAIPEGYRENGGDSTFKLNVNSCTQEQWRRYFGPQGIVNPQPEVEEYNCKPWMSNKHFLEGLYWSINRPQFAKAHGVQPSYNYFSDAYMADPESRQSYNSTDEHNAAIEKFHNTNPTTGEDDFGFDRGTAINRFQQAIEEMVTAGDISYGTTEIPNIINVSIIWMYKSDITEYGDYIKSYFENTFNDSSVCNGRIKLQIQQDAVTTWSDVYYKYLMKGQYDLGFGAISGNSYNPLNFMEVLKSNNSSGFTLCFGADTSKVDAKNPIRFAANDGDPEELWSYDALWAAADHGAVITEGRDLSPIENNYLANVTVDELYDGGQFDVMFDKVEVPNADIQVKKVQLQLSGCQPIDLDLEYDAANHKYHVTITQEQGDAYNKLIIVANDLETESKKPGKTAEEIYDLLHPFRKGKYGSRWVIVIKYTLKITGSTFTAENEAVSYSSRQAQEDARK